MTKLDTTAPNVAQTADDEIDLLALLLTLLRGWKMILAFAFLGLILGVTYSRYVLPTYKTDALLQIDEKSSGIAALGSNISDLVGAESSPAETERELIKSRMVLEPVIQKLHLDIRLDNTQIGILDRIAQSNIPTQTSSEDGVYLETESGLTQISQFEVPQAYLNKSFILTRSSSGFELSTEVAGENVTFEGSIGNPVIIKTSMGDIKIHVKTLPAQTIPLQLTKLSTPSAIDALSQALSVTERGKQTGIVQLTLTGQDQQQVSRVLSQVVQSYVDQNLARGSEQTTTTIEFMESQIPQLKQKLEQAETVFNTFREKYGTIDVTKEGELLLTESAQIESQLSQLNLKKAELLTYYTVEHPLVVQINDQLEVLQSRKQAIKQTISELPGVQREFLQLSEDMEINREIYLTMLKNYEQLKIARAGEIGSVRIVDMPINTFKAIAPKKLQIWVLALLLGTMLGSLLVLARSLLRNTVKDPDRLEAKTGVPVIASIPRSKTTLNLSKNKKTSRLLALIDHDGLAYEGIKSLRTSLMLAMPKVSKVSQTMGDLLPAEAQSTQTNNKQGKVIVITGEAPGIGKSFVSSNLAETFSQLNKKILLIDGDMRRGELHRIFSVSKDNGLGDYLTQSTTIMSEVIQPTSFDFIDFMPRGQHPNNPASLLSTDKFAQMMVQLVAIYDYIIIDTPPLLAVTDAIIISQYADKVLMVTRHNYSVEGQVGYAVKQMNKSSIEVDGIVLNDVVQTITDRYNYHYNYAYANIEK